MEQKLTVKEYTEGLEKNRLLGLKCGDCGEITAPPRMTCRKCSGTNLAKVELSGKGKIVTFTNIRVPPQSRQGQPAYIVAMIALDEGPWLMANLSGTETGTACMELIDRRVRMVTPVACSERRTEGGLAPLFALES